MRHLFLATCLIAFPALAAADPQTECLVGKTETGARLAPSAQIAVCETVLDLAPERRSATHFTIARLHEKQGDYDAALVHYNEALTDPNATALRWARRGRLLMQMGDVEAGVRDMSKAIDMYEAGDGGRVISAPDWYLIRALAVFELANANASPTRDAYRSTQSDLSVFLKKTEGQKYMAKKRAIAEQVLAEATARFESFTD